MQLRSFVFGAIVLAGAAFVTVPEASASQIFNLSGVDLQYGGTLTGTFTTNDALNSVTSYDIVASAGPGNPGHTFTGNDYNGPDSSITLNLVNHVFQLDETSPGQSYELRLVFGSNLSSTSATTITAASSYESESLGGNRSVTAGTAVPVTAATPEPSALILLGTGALGMSSLLRRRIS